MYVSVSVCMWLCREKRHVYYGPYVFIVYQFHFRIRSCEVPKPHDWYVELQCTFAIWQASRQQFCWDARKISQRSGDYKLKSNIVGSQLDCTIKLIWYGKGPKFSVLLPWFTTINYKNVMGHKRWCTALLFLTGLDVISYSEWPILSKFSWELTDNAELVSVGKDHSNYPVTRALLYDRRKDTYLYE